MGSQKRKRIICIICTFVLSFISKIIYILHPFVIKMVSDNFGCLLGGAYLAGLDWRQAAPANYYGQGWYILYSFLFKITSDPYLIYKIIIVTNIVLISSVSILIYFILIVFLEYKDGCFAILASTICVHFITDPGNGTRISSEPPVFIMTWLICFFLIYVYFYKDDRKKRLVGLVNLLFFQSYSLLIHTRMLVIIISIVLCMCLFFLFYKEWIINPIVYTISTIATAGIALIIKKCIVRVLWQSDNTGEIHNYNLGTERIFRVEYSVKSILDTFFSNIYKLIVCTDGIFCLGIILFVVLMISLVVQLRRRQSSKINEYRDKILFILFVTFGLCVVMCICGIVILYADGINKGYIAGKENDRFSGLTYTRYYFSFAGPMLLAIIVIADRKKNYIIKYCRWIFPIWGCLFIYIYRSVAPELNQYLSRFTKQSYTDSIVNNLFITFYIILYLMILCFVLVKHNKIILFVGLMLIEVLYSGFKSIEEPYLQVHSSIAGASYSLISTIEKEVILPKEIYTYKIRKDETQLLLNKYTIIPLDNIEDSAGMNEVLLITGNVSDEERAILLENGYEETVLDENEIIWSDNVELMEYIQTQVKIILGWKEEGVRL